MHPRISGIDKRREISYSIHAGSSKELESDLVEAKAKAAFGKPEHDGKTILGRQYEAAAEALSRRRSTWHAERCLLAENIRSESRSRAERENSKATAISRS
jgi:hypothetical protein